MNLADFLTWLQILPLNLLPPVLLSVVMAAGDVRTRRIPNYLTLGGALAGLLFQALVSGWPGLVQGLEGLLLGFALMVPFYMFFGMGAGDVKAMAALGAWLTLRSCLSVFFYMGLAGGVVALGILIWQGTLWQLLRRGWIFVSNLVLTSGRSVFLTSEAPPPAAAYGMPYGVAIALGMVALVVFGPVM